MPASHSGDQDLSLACSGAVRTVGVTHSVKVK